MNLKKQTKTPDEEWGWAGDGGCYLVQLSFVLGLRRARDSWSKQAGSVRANLCYQLTPEEREPMLSFLDC